MSVAVVALQGEVDIVQAKQLRERLLNAVRNDDAGLVVDLTRASYIDSAGVTVLFELAERLAARQLRFAVVVPPGGLIERVLEIVDIASVAEVHADADAALAALRDSG